MATRKRLEKIIQQNAFDQKKKKPSLKFNSWLGLTSLQTTGPGPSPVVVQCRESKVSVSDNCYQAMSGDTKVV